MDSPKTGPPNDTNAFAPHTRWYENSMWGRIVTWSHRISPIIIALFAFMMALGFDFKRPSDWFQELESQVKTVSTRVDATESAITFINMRIAADSTLVNRKLDALIRFRCRELDIREREVQDICLEVN